VGWHYIIDESAVYGIPICFDYRLLEDSDLLGGDALGGDRICCTIDTSKGGE